MKKVRALAIALIFQNLLAAQVLTTADVLGTSAADPQIAQNQSLQNLAQSLRTTDPLLRQIQLRLGINGSALGDTIYGYLRNEDTYQVQIGFNSLRERQRQRQIRTARAQTYAAESRLAEHRALAERYDALAAYIFSEPKIAACQRLDSLLEREHDLLRQMLAAGIFEVKVSKVLDAEEDKNRNRLAQQAAENLRLLAKNRLRQLAGDFSEIEKKEIATVAELRASVARLKAAPLAADHPIFSVKNAEVGLENAHLNLVSAENWQVFNHFQAGYQRPLYLERPKRFNTFNNVSFRVGLTVPLPANNNFKKSGALLDLREAQNEAAQEQAELQTELENQFVRLENLFRELDLVEDRLANSLIRKMLGNEQLLAQITPLEILELEIAQQKLAVSRATLVAEVASEFAKLLDISGAASAEPRVNFLAKNGGGGR